MPNSVSASALPRQLPERKPGDGEQDVVVQREAKGFAMPLELAGLDRGFVRSDPGGNEALLNAGRHQDPIHLDEGRAELAVVLRSKNARKRWTKLGLEGDHGHVLSFLCEH